MRTSDLPTPAPAAGVLTRTGPARVTGMHEDQLPVDVELARRLVGAQFPRWSHLPLSAVPAPGTVNAVFRLGPSLAARFPLQPGAPGEVRAVLRREAAAAAAFAEVSAVPAPVPVAEGEPSPGYPLPWTVQTWVPGTDAVEHDPSGSPPFALDLAALLSRLRQADTSGRRFSGPGRGGSLPDHDAWVEECFVRSEGLLDVPRLRALWRELRRLPVVDEDVMCHGDLTPPNVLVEAGRLAGVLDTGGYAPADPALDLVPVWHLLEADQRAVVRDALGCSAVQWERGRGWALQQAVGLVWYYAETNPAMSRWGRRTLDRLLADAGP